MVRFENGEDSTALLSGFTIVNGYAEGAEPYYCRGGGIAVFSSSPTLSDLTIVDNSSTCGGGGLGLSNSHSIVTNVDVIDNSNSIWYGGGIYVTGSQNDSVPFSLSNMTIVGNETNGDGGGIAIQFVNNFTLDHVLIAGNSANTGAGIFLDGTNSHLSNLTLVANTANFAGGAIGIRDVYQIASDAYLSNSILYGLSLIHI